MNASADYNAAAKMLKRPLPAYVTYSQKTHTKFGPVSRDDSGTITVRVADGKIVKGKASNVQVQGVNVQDNAVSHSTFDTLCYQAKSARLTKYDGLSAEAIALRSTCDSKGDADFDTLYVNPATHEPLGVTGSQTDSGVAVALELRYARFSDYFMPSLLNVTVKGSGFMFWLDVIAHQEYSNYRFTSTIPK